MLKMFKLQPFTVIVMAVIILAVWYGYPSLHLFSWFFALIILVFTAAIILIWLAGQTRQVFMGGRNTPLPQQRVSTNYIVGDELDDDPDALPVQKVKALPHVPRPFMARLMGGKSSPQADQTGGQTTDRRQVTDDRQTVSADRQVDADRRKVLLYQKKFPGDSVRQTAAAVGFGKDKVAAIINQLKREGAL